MSRIGAGLHPAVALWMCIAMGRVTPLHGQRDATVGWIISAVHPDPTPAMGAPEAEYVALHLQGDEGESCRSAQGLQLTWNGHNRTLASSPCWPVGTTLVVHRSADSLAFVGVPFPKLGLDSWPALVNGGATVALSDADGVVLDALTYSESDLEGGGRPLLRRDPKACGAGNNLLSWTGAELVVGPTEEGGLAAESLESLLDSAARWERLLPRGGGQWEWRIGSPLDPVSRSVAAVSAGAQTAELSWESDSVVSWSWAQRVEEPHPSVMLGPVRTCPRGAGWTTLRQPLVHWPMAGDVQPIAVLPDPWPNDPQYPEEFVILQNRSEHAVDPSGWDWQGGQTMRRRLLHPGTAMRFTSKDVQPWPGMRNGGETWPVHGPSGQVAFSMSWSPCHHHSGSWADSGWPLVRNGEGDAAWHSMGQDAQDLPFDIIGHGCIRDWTGKVTTVQLHANQDLAQCRPRWVRWANSASEGWIRLAGDPVSARTGRCAVGFPVASEDLESMGVELEWTRSPELGPEGRRTIRCPSFDAPPPSLALAEMVWHAADDGGEFMEVVNSGVAALDLRGMQATTQEASLPSDWKTWLDPELSWILQPGEVLALGECPRWFARPYPRKGPALWPVENWSALGNAGGQLRLRLPSSGFEPLLEVAWSDTLVGPWWWQREGWAWTQNARGEWQPVADGGSPGRPNTAAVPPCSPDLMWIEVEQGGWPSVHWAFDEPGHRVSMAVMAWPSGRLLQAEVSGLATLEGQWWWDGLDQQGHPAAPGMVVLDVRWAGPQCAGRKRSRFQVPGYGG